MTLAPGSKFASYEITSFLGSGGMGEVYRARDLRLGREVAVKVLPDELLDSADRLARFEQEARLLASLNHPSIAAVFGVEEFDGRRLLVMELAHGETLADRIARGPIPVAETIEIALAISEALEAAHEQGVVHRDLKPANIRVTEDGRVKLLDFGIATSQQPPIRIASNPDDSGSPTIVRTATDGMTIMGTAGYLSPEQARGRVVDQRADVWAFGVVLWEMLTGRKLFGGAHLTDTIAAVLREEPDFDSLPAGVPTSLRRLLRRCLEKDRRNRLHHIADARLELLDARDGNGLADDAERGGSRMSWREPVLWIALAALVVTVALLARRAALRDDSDLLRRYEIAHGLEADWRNMPAIAPDASAVLYVQGDEVRMRPLDSLRSRTIPQAAGSRVVFWSPDAQSIAFVRDWKLWRLRLGEESARIVATLPKDQPWIAGAWSSQGTIVLAKWRGGLYRVPAQGGEVRSLLEPRDDEVDFHGVSFLPDGETILTISHSAREDSDKLLLVTQGGRRDVHHLGSEGGASAHYAPQGYVVLSRFVGINSQTSIWAIPFSLRERATTGDPILLVDDASSPSVARDGTLTYVSGAHSGPTQLIWLSATGAPAGEEGPAAVGQSHPSLSPDGSRVLYSAIEHENQDIWLWDSNRNLRTRLTFGESEEKEPTWSPDGSRVAYARVFHSDWMNQANGVWIRSIDGSEPERRVAAGSEPHFGPAGTILLMRALSLDAADDLHLARLNDGQVEALVVGKARTRSPRVSPSGHLFAYESNEGTDTVEIYVAPIEQPEAKWQITNGGGSVPRWSHDGRAVMFVRDGTLWAVDVDSVTGAPNGRPRPLFSVTPDGVDFTRGYDVARDGRILAVREIDPGRSALTVVEHWERELR